MFYISALCALLAIVCALLAVKLYKLTHKAGSIAVTKSVSMDGIGPITPNNKTLKRLKSTVGYSVVAMLKDKVKRDFDGDKTTYSITFLINEENEN